MRKLMLLAIVIVAIFSCSKEKKNVSLQQLDLSGNVKAVRWIYYTGEEKFGKPEINDKQNETYLTFDTNGRLIHEYSDSILRDIYTYNQNGKIASIEDVIGKWKRVYNEEGNLTIISAYNSLNTINMVDTLVHKDGKLISIISYFNSQLSAKMFFEYDRHGNKTVEIDYDSHGYLKEKATYIYDSGGEVTEKSTFDSEDKLSGRIEYQYNKFKNEEKAIYYNGNNEIETTYTFSYDYDNKNNWVKKVTYNNKWIERIELREIEYYQ